jgi:hypothetical protein
MIVGRSPRNPVIGDTVLLRTHNRQGYRHHRRHGRDSLQSLLAPWAR